MKIEKINYFKLLYIPIYFIILSTLIYLLFLSLNEYKFLLINNSIDIKMIKTIEEVKELKDKISNIVQNGEKNLKLLLLFSIVYIFNQTFSLPGKKKYL
jgi:hypothetical protein